MPKIDVFLSHHRADEGAVNVLADRLQEENLNPCMDKWNLMPGEAWRDDLQQALDQSPICVVFLGPNRLGPWEHEQMRAYLDRRLQDKSLRVVPVLLPGTTMPERGQLPRFLSRCTWVVFRNRLDDSEGFRRLLSEIRGVPCITNKIKEAIESSIKSTQSPYRGLEKFGPEDAQWFFGRDSEVQQLVEKVKLVEEVNKVRFLAVLGASGSGKSSVVLAGLVPALQKGALPESENWPIRIFRPTEQPLEELAINLVDLFPGGKLQQMAQVGELLRDLESHKRALHLTVRQALNNAPSTQRLLLVVDQFEEAFTLCQNAEAREQFFANLLYASSISGGQTIVVLTMRVDFFAKCAEYPELADRLSSFQFLVTPMVENQLRDVIEKPAKRARLSLDPELADLILNEVMDKPGGLPLLEYTLFELWQRRRGRRLTLDAYHKIGGVTGALAHTADATYELFNEAQRQIAQRILLQLVQPGEGTEDTRRPAKLSDLVPSPEKAEMIEAVLQRLADQRLVTISQERTTDQIVVNMAHEALIRHWPLLQQWIDNNRESLRFHRRLSQAAEEWERLQRAEGALYRGIPLTKAQEWAQQHSDELARQEREFIEASQKLAKKEEDEREAQRKRELQQAHDLAEQQRALVAEQQRRVVLQRWALAGLSMLLLVAVAAAAFGFYQTGEARTAGNQLKVEAAEAERLRNQAEKQVRIATAGQIAAQAQSVREQYPQRSLLLALEALHVTERADEPRVPAAEQVLRDGLANTGGQGLSGHTDSINAVAMNEQWLVTASNDKTALVWNLEELDADPYVLPHSDLITAVAINEQWIVTASSGNTANVWAINDLNVNQDLNTPWTVLQGHTEAIRAVVISEEWIVTGSNDDKARLWALDALNQELNTPRAILDIHTDSIVAVAISEQWIVTGSTDNSAHLWNLQQLRKEFRKQEGDSAPITITESYDLVEGSPASIRAVAVSDQWLVTASSDSTAHLWAINDLKTPEATLEQGTDSILAVTISEQWVVTTSSDGTARVWDLQQPITNPTILKGHSDRIKAVTINNHWLVTGSNDQTARLWDLRQPKAGSIVLRGHEKSVMDVAITSDNHWLVTASDDKSARLWNLQQPQEPPTRLKGCQKPIKIVAISPDNQWVVVAGSDKVACLWNLQQPDDDSIELTGHKGNIESVAINNNWLVTASDDSTALLWNLQQPQPQANPTELKEHSAAIKAVAISDQWVVTRSLDNSLRFWNIQLSPPQADSIELEGYSGYTLDVVITDQWLVTPSHDDKTEVLLWDIEQSKTDPKRLKGHTSSILAIAINGHRLVTGSFDKTAILWDLRQPDSKLAVLRGNENPIFEVAISDKWIATASTASTDKTVRLWDLQQPEAPPVILRDDTDSISTVAISPDEQWLVTAISETIRLWPLGENLKEVACRTAGRNLSKEEWKQYFSEQSYRKTCEDFPKGKGVSESMDSQPPNE